MTDALLCVTLFVVVAGCVGSPTLKAPTDQPTASVEAGPLATSEAARPNGTLDPMAPAQNSTMVFRLQSCRGAVATGEVPIAKATAAIPKEFKPGGLTPQSGGTQIWALACERAVVADRIFGGVAWLQTAVLVEPVNKSWDKPGLDWFVLDSLLHGIPPGLVPYQDPGSFAYSNSTGLNRWEARASSSQRIMYDFHVVQKERLSRASAQYWYLNEGLHRIPSEVAWMDDSTIGPAAIRTEGSGDTAKVFGDVSTVLHGAVYDATFTLLFDDATPIPR